MLVYSSYSGALLCETTARRFAVAYRYDKPCGSSYGQQALAEVTPAGITDPAIAISPVLESLAVAADYASAAAAADDDDAVIAILRRRQREFQLDAVV